MFINHIYRHAREAPDRIAVVSSGRRLSYRRFAQLIDATRQYLLQSPLPPEGVIVEMGGNLLNCWLLQLALRSLGRTTISAVSWQIVEHLGLRDLGTMVCFADNAVAQQAVVATRPDCPVIVIPFDIFAGIAVDHLPAPIEAGRFGDHILFTSGTTGRYKKLLFEGEQLEQLILHGIEGAIVRGIGRDDVYHNLNLGSWTIAGYRVPLAYWYHGATVIFDQRPDWTEHFLDHRPTTAVLMPPMLRALCATGSVRASATPLRVVTGGAFLPADLAMQAIRQLGCELYVNYGGTESRVALESRVRSEEDVVWLSPLFDGAAEIVDADDEPVPPEREGVVRIRLGPTDPTCYIDDPEATAQHFRNGYFYPGDLAVQREDGWVRILGRVSDVLTVGGNKRAIGPFEERARQFLEIANLCLFVQQTDAGADQLLVVIEGDCLPDRARLDAMTASSSRHFSQARYVLLPSFPRSDNGMMKIDRRAVHRLATEADRMPQPEA